MNNKAIFIVIILLTCFISSIKSQNLEKIKYPKNTKGFGILYRLPGIWSGPVSSTTSAGNFHNWFVDLRPVSKSQISQFSLLDANTINNFSIFVIKYKGQKRVALRTEGCFANSCCITYEIIDSVNEAEAYYRFSDFVGGEQRAFTEFRFVGDSMTMEVYTNKFNKEQTPVLHTRWEAKLQDSDEAEKTEKKLKYPKPKPTVDLSDSFINKTESIFFEFNTDPYKSEDQPYTGKINLNISINPELKILDSDEIEILITVKPLFEGIKYLESNLKYASKLVYLPGNTKNFTINDVHPGEYYIYAFVDKNGDKLHTSGELMSSKGLPVINIEPEKSTDYSILIDIVIP